MAVKLYPVGIQTFERIRKKDKLYIDKTEYIYRMAHTGGKYFFLSRPRRFGKSLFVSTLKSYFEGKKDLFKGLAIESLKTEWTEHPVLHFSMATAKHMDVAALKSELDKKLLSYEQIYGKGEGEVNENLRLMGIIMRAYKQTGNCCRRSSPPCLTATTPTTRAITNRCSTSSSPCSSTIWQALRCIHRRLDDRMMYAGAM